MTVDTPNRVQMAAGHWRPRFVANGIDVNDFETVLAKTTEWADWGPNWRDAGAVHDQLGRDAEEQGHTVSATAAYQRAAWCYHLGKFLWFEDPQVPGHLRRPSGVERPPLVLIVPGLDSSKEEMFTIEDEFLRRSMATLSIDGPGQSENSVHFAIRPNWETVITPLLDHLESLGLDGES